MAEINKVSVYSDAAGSPKSGLGDSQRRVVISIDQWLRNRPLYSGQQVDISKDTLTTIVTVPSNGVKFITKIVCSGEENAKWDVYINSTWKVSKRTTDRNVVFEFSTPLKILATEVVDVKATHHGPGQFSTFEATVFGYPE